MCCTHEFDRIYKTNNKQQQVNIVRHSSQSNLIKQKVPLPGKNIGTQHTANDVPKMRHIIDIGQGTGDQDVPFPFIG